MIPFPSKRQNDKNDGDWASHQKIIQDYKCRLTSWDKGA